MLTEILKDIEMTIDNPIASFVIDDLKNSYNDLADVYSHLKDVAKYGCVSGCVQSLIYYSDTEAFFDEYYSDIQKTYDNVVEMYGENFLDLTGNMKNNLAWFAYEHYAQLILDQLEYHMLYMEEK